MLTTIIVVLATWLINKTRWYTISIDFVSNFKMTCFLIIITTILFWIMHRIISYDDNPDRYKKIWDEPLINAAGLFYSLLVSSILVVMARNCINEQSILNRTLILWILLIIYDLANILIMYHSYSYNVKKAVIDAVLFQIRGVRNALLIVLAIVFIMKFTIVGVLFFFVIIGIILSFFK